MPRSSSKSTLKTLISTRDAVDYSLRRAFVDEFMGTQVKQLSSDLHVLDVGGKRSGHRGGFTINDYSLKTTILNIASGDRPHILADAAHLPILAESFEAAICAETLEHVSMPPDVLAEIQRALKPGGILLVTVPFNFRIHGDPHDYGRYTDHYWREQLVRQGFEIQLISKQGLFWSVLVDMLRDVAYQALLDGQPKYTWLRRLIARGIRLVKRKAIDWDAKIPPDSRLSQYTTGFGIVALRT
ncbi:MAG: class I SAM-dependent methyltransferase [Anaerolineae bacterium]|nr:MAG: class I SAM-dependent methyltransferase [Anaerolineae bacterium]